MESESQPSRLLNSRWTVPLFCTVLLLIHIQGLGTPPLAGTEGHRIIPAREMVASGNYAVPTLFGRTYMMKPPLYLWVLAAVECTAGGNNWTWRLPSPLFHAMTLATCMLFARRWFGGLAGVLAGVAFVLEVGLWQEARTADIDPLNTFLTTLGVLALLELMCSTRSARALYAVAWAGLSGACFAKVVGMLPALTGVLIGVPLALRGVRRAFRPPILVLLFASTLPTIAWRTYATLQIHAASLPLDANGAHEGLSRLYPHSLTQALSAAWTPFAVLIYALPTSVLLPFALRRWGATSCDAAAILPALAWSVVAGLLSLAVSGTVNPRYACVLFPPLAIVAAGVVQSGSESSRFSKAALGFFGSSAVCMGVMSMVLLAMLHHASPAHDPIPAPVWMEALLALAASALALAAVMAGGSQRAVALLLIATILAGGPFAEYSNRRRDAHSGIHAAKRLAHTIPSGETVVAGGLIRYEPELFFYLGRPVKSVWKDVTKPRSWAGARWVLLNEEEMAVVRGSVSDEQFVTALVVESNRQRCYLLQLR